MNRQPLATSGKLVEACNNCALPICNDKAAGCAYTIQIKRWNGEDYDYRRDYHERYYQANAERKRKAALDRYYANRP